MSPLLIVTLMALLLGVQPITTDLYLPALPGLAADLHSPMSRTQLTLSALLFAFGFSQLLLGPTADRFGRRPVLLGGLALYVLASAGGALAGTIDALVGWRALQGVGMGAAVVCARAMVRDLYVPTDGARVMSKALSGLGFIALASPIIGGLIATALGWRSALAATGVFGAICLATVGFRMSETARRLNPQALQLAPMLRQWRRILGHPTFLAWSLLVTCTYAGLFAFLASSSFVFIEVLGSSRLACGLYIAGCSLSYIAGTFWCRRWLLRHGLAGAVKRGAVFTLLRAHGRLGRHRDPYAGTLRYHLGLATPNSSACRLQVDDHVHVWRDGEDFLFDSSYVHGARNDTDQPRLVLFCDVQRPMRGPVSTAINDFVARYVLPLTQSPNVPGDPVGLVNRLFERLRPLRVGLQALRRRTAAYRACKIAAAVAVVLLLAQWH